MATTRKKPATPKPGWRPNPGDSITGEVVDVQVGGGEFGDYPIVAVVTEDGEKVLIHAFHSVLKNQLRKVKPMPGDTLTVTFIGKEPTKDGEREFHNYSVNSSSVWSAF